MIRLQKPQEPRLLEGWGAEYLNEALRQQPHDTWFLLLRHVRCPRLDSRM